MTEGKIKDLSNLNFKPEPPKFKQKGVVQVLQLQGLGVTENSWRLEKQVAYVPRRNGEQVLLQRL